MSQSCDEIIETIKAKNTQLDSLHAMMPQMPDELRRLSDQMKFVIDLIPILNGLNGDIQSIAFGVNSLELDRESLYSDAVLLGLCAYRFQGEKRDKFLNWLSSLDPPSRHLDVRTSRIEETGQWFLEDQIVQKWETGPSSSVLLCFGIPGAGKTVLM
jgi:hypothetical protein